MTDPRYMGYDELRDWVMNDPLAAADWISAEISRQEPSLGELLNLGADDD